MTFINKINFGIALLKEEWGYQILNPSIKNNNISYKSIYLDISTSAISNIVVNGRKDLYRTGIRFKGKETRYI